AFHPNGTLYAAESAQQSLAAITPPPDQPVANPRLFTINTSSGIATEVGPLVDDALTAHVIHDITFVGTRLLGISRSPGSKVAEIDIATGEVTPLPTGIGGVFPGAGNLGADGVGTAYYARPPVIAPELYTIDTTTGAAALATGTSGYVDPGTSPRWNALTFLGGTMYLNSTSCRVPVCGGTAALVNMDPTTGVGVLVGMLPVQVDAIAGTVP
ncbi:MAG: hypothetical protein ACYTG6_15145, partial [Planctomycetota bacterium]